MPRALVLYVDDSEVRPALELLRRVCQPTSRSAPHITVRYPVTRELDETASALYAETQVRSLHVVGPDSFGLSEVPIDTNPGVVFLRCESLLLESVVYKPHYPDSVFHFTVYEGEDLAWGRRVLAVLREYRWDFDVRMAPRVGVPRNGSSASPVALTPAARKLLREIRGAGVRPSTLLSLDEKNRLDLVRTICERLHDGLPPRPSKRPREREVAALELATVQPTLWEPDLHEYEDQPPAWKRARRLGRQRTRERGLVVTPPELARDLVVAALDEFGEEPPINFGDPAFGPGVFFATLLRLVDEQRISSAEGIEVDPDRAKQMTIRWRSTPLKVRGGDLLQAKLEATRSLVIANPPYIRFQRLDAASTTEWRKRIQATLDIDVDGRSDLYVYFVLLSHAWLAPDAVSAWLLPSEFLHTNYGASVRAYLTRQVTLTRMHTYDLDRSKFEDVKVSSTLIVFRNRKPTAKDRVQVTVGGTPSHPTRTYKLNSKTLGALPKWTPAQLAARRGKDASQQVTTLGDLFVVRRGIATGSNADFVLSDRSVSELNVRDDWVKPIIPKARELTSNIIEADRKGVPIVAQRLWLIDTELDLETLRRQSPEFASYLDEVWARVGDRTLVRQRQPFYSQEARTPPPFFVSYMARSTVRSRFFLNRSKALVLNNYLGLYPRAALDDLLKSGRISDTDVLDALSAIEARQIEQEGRTYVSGLEKIEPRELARVPITGLDGQIVAS